MIDDTTLRRAILGARFAASLAPLQERSDLYASIDAFVAAGEFNAEMVERLNDATYRMGLLFSMTLFTGLNGAPPYLLNA